MTKKIGVSRDGVGRFQLLDKRSEQAGCDFDVQFFTHPFHFHSGQKRVSGMKVAQDAEQLIAQPLPFLVGRQHRSLVETESAKSRHGIQMGSHVLFGQVQELLERSNGLRKFVAPG